MHDTMIFVATDVVIMAMPTRLPNVAIIRTIRTT